MNAMNACRAVLRSLLVSAFIAFACFSLGAQDTERLEALAANDTSPTFTLTLSPGTRNKIISEYRVGDDMWMTIVMTNLTNHDIDASVAGDSSYDRMFGYEAIDEDGKPVKERHHGTEGYNHTAGIGAGGNVTREFLLNRAFKLDRPCKYVIRVSRKEPFVKDEKGEPPVIWSNPITITITG
jgi:hypothetical protein